jgi:hypothetical protein
MTEVTTGADVAAIRSFEMVASALESAAATTGQLVEAVKLLSEVVQVLNQRVTALELKDVRR